MACLISEILHSNKKFHEDSIFYENKPQEKKTENRPDGNMRKSLQYLSSQVSCDFFWFKFFKIIFYT